MTHNVEVGFLDYRHIGSRDLFRQIQTGMEYSFDITFNPINEEMIKYGIDLPAGTGTIERSLTILFSQKINGTETFIIYTGCRCDSTDIEITSDSAIEVSQTWLARDRQITTTPGFTGTPDYVEAGDVSSVEPWTNLDGTTTANSPLTWNTTTNYIDVNSFSCSISNNLERIKPNGQKINKFVEPTLRDIEWEFSTWLKDTSLQTDAAAATAREMIYRLKAGSGAGSWQLRFSNAKINSETSSDATSATESKMLELSGKATSVVMENMP